LAGANLPFLWLQHKAAGFQLFNHLAKLHRLTETFRDHFVTITSLDAPEDILAQPMNQLFHA